MTELAPRLCDTLVLDVRRHFACGIGRVSLNLAEAALRSRGICRRLALITSPANAARVEALARGDAELITVDYPFFSSDDLFELPRLVADLGGDVYIAPQFYISPFFRCRTIKMIHDLWPLLQDRWLPTEEEIASHFGAAANEGIRTFVAWFEAERTSLPSWKCDAVRRLYEENPERLPRYMLAMYCAAIDTAAIVPTSSEYARQQILDVFPHAAPKLQVLYPYVTPFASSEPKARHFSLLHVGKFEPRKNHQILCEAFIHAYEALPVHERGAASLTLVGDVSYRSCGRELVAYVERVAQKYPIRFVGVVSDEELRTLYRSAWALVFPSLFEGFGIPILEAMAASTPVITANRGGMREAAGDAAFLLDDLSAESLAAAMLELYRDDSFHAELARRGRHRVGEFSFDSMRHRFVELVGVATATDGRRAESRKG